MIFLTFCNDFVGFFNAHVLKHSRQRHFIFNLHLKITGLPITEFLKCNATSIHSCATLLKCGTTTLNQLSFILSYYRHITLQKQGLAGFANCIYNPHIYIRFWRSSIKGAIPCVRFIVETDVGPFKQEIAPAVIYPE